MSKLHLVFGGRVKDPRALDFDLKSIDLVGVYDSYAAAEEAWRGLGLPGSPGDSASDGATNEAWFGGGTFPIAAGTTLPAVTILFPRIDTATLGGEP